MAFIHMKPLEIIAAQRAQQSDSADAKNDFLAKTVVCIPTVKSIRQRAVPIRIIRQLGIEQEYRHDAVRDAFDLIFPGSQLDLAAFDRHR